VQGHDVARALLPAVAADDKRICPPQIPGQLSLLRTPRVFAPDHAQRIKDRPNPDLSAARVGIGAVVRERGLNEQSRHVLVNMARLALAARDPDQRRVFVDDLHQIPEQRTALAHALARTGLLQPGGAAAAGARGATDAGGPKLRALPELVGQIRAALQGLPRIRRHPPRRRTVSAVPTVVAGRRWAVPVLSSGARRWM
jgi:hypothetical protein